MTDEHAAIDAHLAQHGEEVRGVGLDRVVAIERTIRPAVTPELRNDEVAGGAEVASCLRPEAGITGHSMHQQDRKRAGAVPWDTRITWPGSPLPQSSSEISRHSAGEQTASQLPQNSGVTPA